MSQIRIFTKALTLYMNIDLYIRKAFAAILTCAVIRARGMVCVGQLKDVLDREYIRNNHREIILRLIAKIRRPRWNNNLQV